MANAPYYQAGVYWGRVTKQALGKTRNDNPQFVLRFLVLGKVDPANPTGDLISCEQYERSVYRVITDKTIPFVLEDLATLGFSGDSFRLLDPSDPDCHDFTDQQLAFYCQHESYEGVLREKWGIARSGGEVEPLAPKEVRQLDAMFGDSLRQAAKQTKVKPVEKPVEATVAKDVNDELSEVADYFENAFDSIPDDEVPF